MSSVEFPVLVAGAGNRYMGDDGAGPHFLELLEERSCPHLHLVDCGTDLFTLAGVERRYPEVILVDAVRTGATPGTVHWFTPDNVADYSLSGSVHQLSAIEALQLIPLMSENFSQIRFSIVGIEPGEVSFQTGLSDPVESVLQSLLPVFSSEQGIRQVLEACRNYRNRTPELLPLS